MRMDGRRIVIRSIEEEDLPLVLPWWNDPEVMYYADDDLHPSLTLQDLQQRHAKEIGEWRHHMERMVIETKDTRLIGDIMYRGYQSDVRSAYMGLLIGMKDLWGQGYGTEAIWLFLEYLFVQKEMHKVAITVSDFNTRAIKAYEKCGFRRDGVLRDNATVEGKYVNHLLMSLLEEEYAHLKSAGFDPVRDAGNRQSRTS